MELLPNLAPTTSDPIAPIVVAPQPLPARAVAAPTARNPTSDSQPGNQSKSRASRKGSGRYESLDMWRGAACLMLVLFHAAFFATTQSRMRDPSSWSPAGIALNAIQKTWCGVPIFFVVSGYCIAASLDSLGRKPRSMGSFFARRFHRIYPPLWIAAGIAALFLGLLHLGSCFYPAREHLPMLSDLSLGHWLGNLTITESWLPHVVGGEPRFLMPNTWTLCYEEQFYALAGLFLLVAPRRTHLAVTGVSLLTLLVRAVCRTLGVSVQGVFFDGHWLLFAAGMLVFQAVNYFGPRRKLLAAAVLLAGAVYGWSERKFGPTWFDRHLGEYLIASSLFALFLIAAHGWDRAIAAHWLARPLVWCGQRSYSIYLVHFGPVVALSYFLFAGGLRSPLATVLVTVPACVTLAVSLGWVFHRLVETRFQNTPQAAR